MHPCIQLLPTSDVEILKRRILPSASDDRQHLVYWLHDSSCASPVDSGYVGVVIEDRRRARFLEHTRSGRFPSGVSMTILLRGYSETCYLYEHVLRPQAHIGWNIACGGARGNKCGIPKSDVTKAKIGAANTGKSRPDLAQRNKMFNAKRQHIRCVGCHDAVTSTALKRSHRKCFTKFIDAS